MNMDEIIEDIKKITYIDQDIGGVYGNILKFLNLAEDSFVLIQWPESQEYMEEDWFKEEAVLDVESKFGSSAYFIPLKRLL